VVRFKLDVREVLVTGDPAGGSASFKALERQGWTEKASAYEAWAGRITTGAIEPLLDAAQVGSGMRVLDVACGPGDSAARAAARGATAIGIDFAPTMVSEAKRRFPQVDYRDGDGENLAFADDGFDAVICAFGLLHMPEPERAIAEAYRVLRPGGHYAFTVWAPPDRHEFFNLVMDAIQTHGQMDVPLPPAPPIFRFSDPEECRRTLTATGFSDVSVQEVPLIWRAKAAKEVVEMIYKSTVRTAMLLEHQAPDARNRIHAAITEGAARLEKDGSYTMAFPAVLSAARKL
jgi:ubiquinone/menaquinone biosynthesis C-methylase UbiE